MIPKVEPILDLDLLLRGNQPSPPAESARAEPTPPPPERETPPPLIQRLCDEIIAKARLLGWPEAELERLARSGSEDDLLAARERVARELSLRFVVPPLYPADSVSGQTSFDYQQFK
ncbi:MAG: hypothetical protein OEM52_10490 [bacterium]|nr:hypothetical protein [bacterium]